MYIYFQDLPTLGQISVPLPSCLGPSVSGRTLNSFLHEGLEPDGSLLQGHSTCSIFFSRLLQLNILAAQDK